MAKLPPIEIPKMPVEVAPKEKPVEESYKQPMLPPIIKKNDEKPDLLNQPKESKNDEKSLFGGNAEKKDGGLFGKKVEEGGGFFGGKSDKEANQGLIGSKEDKGADFKTPSLKK